jgi:hypothetical protein
VPPAERSRTPVSSCPASPMSSFGIPMVTRSRSGTRFGRRSILRQGDRQAATGTPGSANGAGARPIYANPDSS